MKILVSRHAEDVGSEYVEEERCLTKKGRKQAISLGKLIKRFNPTHLYHSSLLRSKQTASFILNFVNPIVTETSLIDEQYSGTEGLDVKKSRGYIKLSESFNGGETYKKLLERALAFWKMIQKNHNADSNDKIVVITHGRFMTFLVATILDLEPNGFFLEIDNCSYIILNISPNWRPSLVLPTPKGKYLC
ncbi:MAG: histidine phosphatase family protein [Candidatus Heimdallarchaeaceae archaeon]